MLNKIDKSLLASLVTTDSFSALKNLVEELSVKWGSQQLLGEDEFHYLKVAFERDGKIKGLKELLEHIENLYKVINQK